MEKTTKIVLWSVGGLAVATGLFFAIRALLPKKNDDEVIDKDNYMRLLEKELKVKAKRNYMPLQKGDVKVTLSDTNLLKQITGYKPQTNYKIGIKRFLSWFKSYYK